MYQQNKGNNLEGIVCVFKCPFVSSLVQCQPSLFGCLLWGHAKDTTFTICQNFVSQPAQLTTDIHSSHITDYKSSLIPQLKQLPHAFSFSFIKSLLPNTDQISSYLFLLMPVFSLYLLAGLKPLSSQYSSMRAAGFTHLANNTPIN